MTTTTATQKGQVLIPVALRKKFNIHKGTRLSVKESNGKIVLEPLADDFICRDRGVLKTQGKLVKQLLADREAEAQQ